MNLPRNVHAWGFFGLLLQWFIFTLHRISPHIEVHYQISILIGTWLAFFVLAIGHRKTRIEKHIKTKRTKSSNVLTQQAVKILASMYAVIAGLSLTTAVKEFTELTDIFLGLENTIVFFATALPFYNGVTMFLITNYYLRGFEGRTKEPLVYFLLLFSGAIALYGMAASIDNQYNFIVSFLILLSVNVVWIAHIIFKRSRYKLPHEWLWLDIYMFGFLPLLLVSSQPTNGILMAVAIPRTITDYIVAGRYYLPA